MNVVELSYFFAMRDLGDGPRIQAQLLDNLLTLSARDGKNGEMVVRSPCARVADIPHWRVTILRLVGGVVGFVENEGFDGSL